VNVTVLEKGDWLFIRLRPVKVWAYGLFGLVFLAAGAWVVALLGRGVRLSCPADPAGECSLARVTVAGWHGDAFPVTALRGARVDTVTSLLYARMDLVLVTASGDRAVPLVVADGDDKLRLADEIRRYVAAPASLPLEVREDARRFGLPLGVIVAVAGLLILLAPEMVHVVADRSAGALVVRRRRFGRIRTDEIRLDEIESVSTPAWRVRGAESCSVLLHLTGRRELSLTRTPLFTGESAAEVVAVLERWRVSGQGIRTGP
jgi:hypothetical protein